MDDASRLIVGYGAFQEATAENTIQVLKQAISKYRSPHEILTDRGSQFYTNEGERERKASANSKPTSPTKESNISYAASTIPKPMEN